MNTALNFITNFFNEYKGFKYIILLSFLMVTYTGYLCINCLLYGVHILNYIEDQSKYNQAIELVISQTLKIIIIYIVWYIQPIFVEFAMCRLYTFSLKYFTFKALNVSQNLHRKLGPGKLRLYIERKTTNTVQGIKLIIFDLWHNLVFCIVASISLLIYFNIYVFLYSIFNGLLFCAIVLPSAKVRNAYRTKYTHLYDQLIKSIYRIITNYEIIKANNQEEDSIEDLTNDLTNVEDTGVSNAVFTALSNFITKLVCEIPNIVIYMLILRNNKKIGITDVVKFVLFKILNESTKYRAVYIMTEYFKLNQFYIDIINNDWDNIECDIENMVMYFEFQKRHEVLNFSINTTSTQICCQYNNKAVRDLQIITKTLNKTCDLDGDLPFIFTDKMTFRDFSISVLDRVLINKTNFCIKKGEKVGLVGKNGTGKSTLLNVLLRFRDYNGDIFIDGIEMRKCYKVDQRSKISYISQDPGLLDGTISENIIYNNNTNFDKLVSTCDDFNMQFDNLDDNVGENGRNLSGGQIKRISFLRGVVKDGTVLILDEPTSSFDNQTEKSLIDSIHTNLQSKTVIAVLHKHSLLESFDKIIGIYNYNITVYNSYKEFIRESHLY